VNPLVGGGLAALSWGLSAVVASRSTKIIGSQQVLAWVLLLGLAIVAPVAVVSGPPQHSTAGAWAWVITSGVTSNLGLLLMYEALRIGKVGVVAPIGSTEGAIAAVLSVLVLGEQLNFAEALALTVIVCGVVIVTVNGTRGDLHVRAALYALAAATFFGVGLVALARGGADIGPYWTLTGARVVGVAIIVLPLLARRSLPWPGRTRWMVTFSAGAEIVGQVSYVDGSRHSVAITAVLASQYAAVAAFTTYLVFGERLSRRQLAGAVLILAGVALLAAVRP
jgi:drug/metabolite transporter (DMT)-like permease